MKDRRTLLLGLCAATLLASCRFSSPLPEPAPAALQVRVLQHEAQSASGEWTYFGKALKLALDKTDGGYEFVIIDRPGEQDQSLRSVGEDRTLDVTWTMTSSSREAKYRPVRIPLLRGLLGYRVLLIREGDPRFDEVMTAADLRALTAGQGVGWPDVPILTAAGLPVATGADFEGLFDLLEQGAVDYFPRGVTEAWDELGDHPDLKVEDHLLLRYRAAIYFFVHPEADDLAVRIERGLRAAMADGSLDVLFEEHYGEVIRRSLLPYRTIIELDNPGFPAETPLDEALWFDPAK